MVAEPGKGVRVGEERLRVREQGYVARDRRSDHPRAARRTVAGLLLLFDVGYRAVDAAVLERFKAGHVHGRRAERAQQGIGRARLGVADAPARVVAKGDQRSLDAERVSQYAWHERQAHDAGTPETSEHLRPDRAGDDAAEQRVV